MPKKSKVQPETRETRRQKRNADEEEKRAREKINLRKNGHENRANRELLVFFEAGKWFELGIQVI